MLSLETKKSNKIIEIKTEKEYIYTVNILCCCLNFFLLYIFIAFHLN